MNIEGLIAESRALEEVASKIQNDKRTGLTKAEVENFIERYRDWYTDCLTVVPEDREPQFRLEYEGTWYAAKIKDFLQAPTEPNVLYQAGDGGSDLISYWQHPYKDTFRAPLLTQRQILLEVSKRRGTVDTTDSPTAKIELITNRFHLVARQLQRRHGARPTIQISDEYDVQDLFHSLLKLFFDDVRPEEASPSYAGGNSRIDYLLKSEQMVIELKKTRPNLKAREVRDQLLVDISAYRTHPDCKTLIAFVYDPDMYLDNPTALENDLSRITDGIFVKVIVAQR